MVQLRNNFDGGTDGVAITTSNSGLVPGNNAFDVVQGIGTGLILAYANVGVNSLDRPTAEYVMKIDTGSTLTEGPGVGWGTALGSQAQVWSRFYIYFSTVGLNTSDSQSLYTILATGSGGGSSLVLSTVAAPYRFGIYNNTTGAITYGTAAPTAGVWCRIETKITMSTTVGSTECYFYDGANADTTTYTDYLVQTGQNYQAATATYSILGQIAGNQTNGTATYFSNWEVNTTGYPGPEPFRQGLGTPSGNLTNPVAIHMN